MNFNTIRSKDGKLIYHGFIINWMSTDEFVFVPQRGSIMKPMWCKTDWWDIL